MEFKLRQGNNIPLSFSVSISTWDDAKSNISWILFSCGLIRETAEQENSTVFSPSDWLSVTRKARFLRILCGLYHENWLVQEKKKWHGLIEILNKRYNSWGMVKIVTLSSFMTVPVFMTSKKMSVAANGIPLNNVVIVKETFKIWCCLYGVLLNIQFLLLNGIS